MVDAPMGRRQRAGGSNAAVYGTARREKAVKIDDASVA